MALINVSSYLAETPVPWFRSKVKCAKCGARGNRIRRVLPLDKRVIKHVADWSGWRESASLTEPSLVPA